MPSADATERVPPVLSKAQRNRAVRGRDYIIGNPPFVGASMMTAEQKRDAVGIFGKGRRVNSIDYVGAWYCKSAELMRGTLTRTAFVSTNSITQGEQVAALWGKLLGGDELPVLVKSESSGWRLTLADCVRRHVGAKDFINNDEKRYCQWLKGVSPSVCRGNREVMRRLEAVLRWLRRSRRNEGRTALM